MDQFDVWCDWPLDCTIFYYIRQKMIGGQILEGLDEFCKYFVFLFCYNCHIQYYYCSMHLKSHFLQLLRYESVNHVEIRGKYSQV